MASLALAAAATMGAASTAVGAPAASKGDPVAGKAVFARCAACHDVKPGTGRLGPSLAQVFGRKAGTAPGFAFSPAMKGSKIVWSAQSLDAYLTSPTRTVPGNRMAFAGLANPVDRANLIAYLRAATK